MRFQYWIRLSGKQVPCTSSTRVSPPLADDIGFEIIDLHPLVQLSLGNPASPAAMLEEAASDASSLQYASETMRNEPETKCGRVFDTSKRCQILDRFFGSATQPTGMRIHSAAWGHDLIVHRHSHSSLRFYSDAILIHQFSACSLALGYFRMSMDFLIFSSSRTGASGSALRHIGEQLQRFVSPIRPRIQ